MQQTATNDFPVAEASVYHLSIEPVDKHIRVKFNGEIIADITRAKMLHKTRLVPVHYLPCEDIRMEFLPPTDHETHCPFKGQASRWTVTVGGKVTANATWAYKNPFDATEKVGDRISFYWSQMDHWYVGDEEVGAPEWLAFTVIGAEANEVARIEVLTKKTRTPIAIAERFNQCYPGKPPSIGRFKLRGVDEEREIFTLPVEN